MIAIAMHEQERRNFAAGARGGAACAKAESAEEPASKGSAPALFRILRRDRLIS